VNERATPFGLVFAEIGPAHFPTIARALASHGRSSADRDGFVLLEPVAHLVHELAGADVAAEEMEAHLVLLHHAFRHWEAGRWVYRLSEAALERAAAQESLSGDTPREAVYLQLPAGRVWRSRADAHSVPEPLDGMFVTRMQEPGTISVLGVFGMHQTRPGFSAMGIEGRADEHEAAPGERMARARRPDGSPLFAPLLTGGAGAGLYSILDADELMMLTWRILALPEMRNVKSAMRDGGTSVVTEGEQIVHI
jgi:hypothetical protein